MALPVSHSLVVDMSEGRTPFQGAYDCSDRMAQCVDRSETQGLSSVLGSALWQQL